MEPHVCQTKSTMFFLLYKSIVASKIAAKNWKMENKWVNLGCCCSFKHMEDSRHICCSFIPTTSVKMPETRKYFARRYSDLLLKRKPRMADGESLTAFCQEKRDAKSSVTEHLITINMNITETARSPDLILYVTQKTFQSCESSAQCSSGGCKVQRRNYNFTSFGLQQKRDKTVCL